MENPDRRTVAELDAAYVAAMARAKAAMERLKHSSEAEAAWNAAYRRNVEERLTSLEGRVASLEQCLES